MSAPEIKGWCPSAYQPMMSGDGLLVRVRPFLGAMRAVQCLAVCDIAAQFGNGMLDLTSRANLQIRGVSENAHTEVVAKLAAEGLIDHDAAIEHRRAVLTTPLWSDGDLTSRLHAALLARLGEMPDLPSKMGIALDTGAAPVLQQDSADFRFERDGDGSLILRADGNALGRSIPESDAIDALIAMAEWFCKTGGRDAGRMARHLRQCALPTEWAQVAPAAAGPHLSPGSGAHGYTVGVPFGKIQAADLRALIAETGATAIRLTPWRMIILEAVPSPAPDVAGFVLDPDGAFRDAHACTGAPACSQGLQPTQALARHVASFLPAHKSLHVTGCAKSCAFRGAADVTLVGTATGYDLVRNGAPWDEPERRALQAHDITRDLVG